MEFENFFCKMKEELSCIEIGINKEETRKFFEYMQLLLLWNEKINLTAITEPDEIVVKHFVDSLSINKYIGEGLKIIDVGTGAGFPGIPLAIYREDIKVTLLDSLNKRINFLNEVSDKLGLKSVYTNHGRAEDCGQDKKYRESYDIAVSRAVAPLNVLSEYLLPFVKVGGFCICMKGPNINEEIENTEKVIDMLGGKLDKIEKIRIKDMERNILIIKKIANTKNIYPRKAGIPSKKPLSCN